MGVVYGTVNTRQAVAAVNRRLALPRNTRLQAGRGRDGVWEQRAHEHAHLPAGGRQQHRRSQGARAAPDRAGRGHGAHVGWFAARMPPPSLGATAPHGLRSPCSASDAGSVGSAVRSTPSSLPRPERAPAPGSPAVAVASGRRQSAHAAPAPPPCGSARRARRAGRYGSGKPLPRGRYVVYSRVVTRAGAVETSFTAPGREPPRAARALAHAAGDVAPRAASEGHGDAADHREAVVAGAAVEDDSADARCAAAHGCGR